MMKRVFIFILFMFPALLFGSEGESFFNKYFWFTVVNFLIYVGLLYYFLKKPTLDFFKNRRKTLEKEMEESAKFLEETKQELQKYRELMDRIDEKIEEIKEYTVRAEEKEVEEMLRAAESYAIKMKEDAKKIAEQEVDRAVEKLREEIAELVTKSAEESIKKLLNGDLQAKLVEDVINRLKEK